MKVPAASSDFAGEPYKDVVSDLEDSGFTNVETKEIPDLITGLLTKDGEVEDVKIDGKKEFESGDEFAKDAEVVVSFHTFPEDEEEEPEPSETPSEEPSETPAATEAAPKILTPQNNEDLAAALAVRDNCDASLAGFAKEYKGQTIAFNGSVITMAPHGSFDSRFDILIGPGAKGPETTTGPTFQFVDESIVSDLNLTGNVPDSFGMGQKARFTAQVGEFNRDTCLFHLEPIETKIR